MAKEKEDGAGDTPPEGGVTAAVTELRTDRPGAEEMFGRFMCAVASRPLSVHQPAGEIADTAARLTEAWRERRAQFAEEDKEG